MEKLQSLQWLEDSSRFLDIGSAYSSKQISKPVPIWASYDMCSNFLTKKKKQTDILITYYDASKEQYYIFSTVKSPLKRFWLCN